MKERATSNAKVKQIKVDLGSQIINGRQIHAANIDDIKAKHKSVLITTKSKQVDLIKQYMTKIKTDRSKRNKALEKEKEMSRERLKEEQRRCHTIIQLKADINAHKISILENKSQALIDHERKKQSAIVKSVKDKSAKNVSQHLITTNRKLAECKIEYNKKNLKLVELIDQEKQKSEAKIKHIDTKCFNTILNERKIRVDAINNSKNKLKRAAHIIKEQKQMCHTLK